jgi:hypothetical protein
MLAELVAEGEKLGEQVEWDARRFVHVLEGVEFEKWTAEVILYLERHHPDSSLTAKAIDQTRGKVGYDEYQFLLGLMKALQETGD